MAYRLLGEVVPDLAKINIIGVFFWAAAQNWWVTADGGVICYTAILPKLWPTALGTDEGVRPPTNLVFKHGAKIYSVGDPWKPSGGRTNLL